MYISTLFSCFVLLMIIQVWYGKYDTEECKIFYHPKAIIITLMEITISDVCSIIYIIYKLYNM